MGHHLANSREEIDAIVYARVAEYWRLRYQKCNPQELFEKLNIPYRFRHDVFCSLKRLEADANIRKLVFVTRPSVPGRARKPAARRVELVPQFPPMLPVTKLEEVSMSS